MAGSHKVRRLARLLRSKLEKDRLSGLVRVRTPLNHDNVPFVVCWSQKAGCTTVLKWFLYHAGLLEEALAYRGREHKLQIHSYENQVLKARPGYKRNLIRCIEAGKPLVNFMRCPYARVFSSFMHINNPKFLHLAKRKITTPGMAVRQDIVDFEFGRRAALDSPISFLGYLSWLESQTLSETNPHHTPQLTPLFDKYNVSHYRLEQFEVSIAELEYRFTLNSSRPAMRLFTSPHHRRSEPVSRRRALSVIRQGVRVSKLSEMAIPAVNRELLAGTEFEPAIQRVFARDIAVYDSIAALPSCNGASL